MGNTDDCIDEYIDEYNDINIIKNIEIDVENIIDKYSCQGYGAIDIARVIYNWCYKQYHT